MGKEHRFKWSASSNYIDKEVRCSTHMMINAVFFYNKKWYCKECRDKLIAEMNPQMLVIPEPEEIKYKVEKI